MEAAECPPTFDTPPALVQAVMAGGRGCVFRSREGAEDDARGAAREIRKRAKAGDAVVGVAASGVTPFVRRALGEARRKGARTVLVTCNRMGVPRDAADVVITAVVGPEVVAGSTRLKAGSATKLILNRLTVATMVRLGKVHGNRMVDLQPKSAKLRDRARRIVTELTGLGRREAEQTLRRAGNRTKVAVVMARCGMEKKEAERLLASAGGSLRGAFRISGDRSEGGIARSLYGLGRRRAK